MSSAYIGGDYIPVKSKGVIMFIPMEAIMEKTFKKGDTISVDTAKYSKGMTNPNDPHRFVRVVTCKSSEGGK